MVDETKIEALRAKQTEAWARAYEADAEVDRFYGEPLAAEFHAAMAAVWRRQPGAEERKERAYVRLQATRVLRSPDAMMHIDESDRPKIAAEVERLRAESAQG